ncbi:MAG: hypothetical protein JNM19_17775 [Chitinophagaceae bacterium]|nr:hypothetical protein [Chitinophagaceae bacterium]
MLIQTIHKTLFVLEASPDNISARLTYQQNDFRKGEIETGQSYALNPGGTGIWLTSRAGKTIARIKVEPGAQISIKVECRKKKYFFKKSTGWKLRFSLQNKEGEELLTLLPAVNWIKESHDYILQLNEEFEDECDSFLILQALHCANLSMSMMTGGKVPALISI